MSAFNGPTSVIPRQHGACFARESQPLLITIEAIKPGVWLVRSSDDRFGGTFVCQKAALKFVREETAAAAVRGATGMIRESLTSGKRTVTRPMAADRGLEPAA